MQKFELTLRNEKEKLYRRLSVFILILNIAAIAWLLYLLPLPNTAIVTGTMSAGLLLFSLYSHLAGRAGMLKKPAYFATVSLTVFFWLLAGHWWAGIIVAALFFLQYINNRKLTVVIFPDKIEYPSFPKHTIEWDELNNVILKDGLLTIDFKNNRIIQQFTEESMTTGNEKEFNDFCRQLLKK